MDKFFKRCALSAGVIAMISLADVPGSGFNVGFIREAQAVVVRRAPVATAVVVTSVASSSASASAAAQANANAAAQANQAAADSKAAAAKTPPAVGTIVTTLPAGCTQTKLNNVDYMRCGSTYYKPGLMGDTVVFVVAQP